MAGYYRYSMSNNAVDAYNAGEMPFSAWTKTAILKDVAEIYGEKLAQAVAGWSLHKLKDVFLYNSSWHHTSKMYNRTDFYSVREDLNTTEAELWEDYRPEIPKEFNFAPERQADFDASLERCGFWTSWDKNRGKWEIDGDLKKLTAPDTFKDDLAEFQLEKVKAAIRAVTGLEHGAYNFKGLNFTIKKNRKGKTRIINPDTGLSIDNDFAEKLLQKKEMKK